MPTEESNINIILNEESLLLKNFLNNQYFKCWDKNYINKTGTKEESTLLLCITPICNTKCDYCYYKNYSDKLYPEFIADKEKILNNTKDLFNWLKKNNYIVPSVEIFSGEFLNLPYFEDIIAIVYDYSKYIAGFLGTNRLQRFVIPTNGTFCLTKERLNIVESALNRYTDFIYFHISFSIDGKYMDNITRPLRNGKLYTDDFYDNVAAFTKRYIDSKLIKIGFHPMISNKNLSGTIANMDWYFNWIISIYGNYDRAINHFSFLEVRNPDWSETELIEFFKVIKHWANLIYKNLGSDLHKFFPKCIERPFNDIFTSCESKLKCSFTYGIEIRLGDLALLNCHRTAYEELIAGYFDFTSGDLDIIPKNIYPYIFGKSYSPNLISKCASCDISSICNGTCSGCNYEVNKEMFKPVLAVCDLERVKLMAVVAFMLENNIYDQMYLYLIKRGKYNLKKLAQLNNLKNEYLKSEYYGI